jgi:hypothetical protein
MRFATRTGLHHGGAVLSVPEGRLRCPLCRGAGGARPDDVVGLHCRLIGRPGKRAGPAARFLQYAQSHEGVWFPRRLDIARHWARIPTRISGSSGPRRWTRSVFVERFGGIFEHSPWIAEQAWNLELGPAHDSAGGLHNALCRVFRSASEDARLAS